MKLSMNTAMLHGKVGDFEAIRMIGEAGFDCVSYDFPTCALGDDYREYAVRLRGCMLQNGLTCNQAHAPYLMSCGERFDLSEPHYQMGVRSIEAAAVMGAKNIVFHAIDVSAEKKKVDFEEYNIRYFHTLEPYCEKFGIHIALENLFRWDPKTRAHFNMLSTPDDLCRMIDRLSSPWFAACVDTGHAFITGTEPEDFLRGMKRGTVKALHIHDADYISDRHRLPFAEDINWREVMLALKEIGYDGDVTYEIGGFLKKFPEELMMDALRFSEKVGRHLIELFKKSQG